MTNPYQQQHGASSFTGSDPGGLPPLNVRRPSYASVVSGGGPNNNRAAAARSGAFSHILNPSPDASDPQHQPHDASNPYARFDPTSMSYTHLGGGDDDADPPGAAPPWPPRLGSSFPYFSRAFDLYMSKDPLLTSSSTAPPAAAGNSEDVRIPAPVPTPYISSTGFLAPSYLRGTSYLQKLEERHHARLLAERDGVMGGGGGGGAKGGPPAQNAGGIPSRLASNAPPGGPAAHLPAVGTKVSGVAHRGVAYDVVEKTHFAGGSSTSLLGMGGMMMGPAGDEDGDDGGVSPLPARWNRLDKEAALEVLGDGYEVRHTGRATGDHEASAVRADHYMAPACGVYYFEVTVLNTRSDRVKTPPIAIGFASKDASISRAPGWEPDSWGYHGDDGNSFASQNVGKPYAEMYGVGDTIGCLVNFRLNHALFTKNGRELSIAFKDIPFKDVKGKLYPIVGLKKKEDHIMANFGQRPFMFDIDGYMKSKPGIYFTAIGAGPARPQLTMDDFSRALPPKRRMLLNFRSMLTALIHRQRQTSMIEDEIRAADATQLVPGLSETELIQQLVLQFLQHDGYVETARAFAEELHAEKSALRLAGEEPVQGINVRDDEDAHNRQRIRRAVLEGDIERAMNQTKAHYPTVLDENRQVYFRLRCRKFIEMIRREAELRMLLDERRMDAALKSQRQQADDNDEEMLDNGGGGGDMDISMTEDANNHSSSLAADMARLSKLSQDALAFGMELRGEFKGDQRRETARQLDEIFSLIAYPNPLRVKQVAHLLDGSGRVAVAEELNSAILMSLGKSSRAALENVYAQTAVLLEDLRQDGGDGAFVTLDSVVAGIPPSKIG